MAFDLDQLSSREEIREVVARYCRGADRLDWDLVRSCFHPDARDEHGLYDGDVDGMIAFFSEWSATHYQSAMHLIGNQIGAIAGDSAVSEAYCLSYLRLIADKASSPRFAALFDPARHAAVLRDSDCDLVDLTIAVRFVDRFERRRAGGPWLIAHRTVVHEWDRLDPVRAHFRSSPAHGGRRDRSDTIFQRLGELSGQGAA